MIVRDENDIIADNIRHHLRVGIHAFIVIDHGSHDGTFETLTAMQQEGFPITLFRRDRNEAPSTEWYLPLLQEARRQQAKRCLLIDADEFWLPLRGSFAALDWSQPAITANRFNMLAAATAINGREKTIDSHVYRIWRPHPGTDYRNAVLSRQGRIERAYPVLFTALEPKIAFLIEDLERLEPAGHGVILKNGEFSQPPSDGSLMIFHYPIRNLAQFERKLQAFAAAFARHPEWELYMSWETRYQCELYSRGEHEPEFRRYFPSPQELQELLAEGVLTYDSRLAGSLTGRDDSLFERCVRRAKKLLRV